MFINRKQELKLLQTKYTSNRAEFFVLYGRRRIGKTELLRHFCQDKAYIFYIADLATEANSLAEFTRRVSEYVYDDETLLSPFTDWDRALRYVATLAKEQRIIVIFDEFTYLIEKNPAIASIFQRLWDSELKQTQIMLILCGSYVGMIEEHVLSHSSPLYGRRTGQWQLQPFSVAEAHQMLPQYAIDDMVNLYATVGGVASYLDEFKYGDNFLEQVEQQILTKGNFLYEEARFLLREQLRRSPDRYFSILEAIAHGNTRNNAIAQASKVEPSQLSHYLESLKGLGLIERIVPITEDNPEKSKQGIYRLLDSYLRFWFRYVYPNRSALERNNTTRVQRLVAQTIDQFTGQPFELICQEYIRRHYIDDVDVTDPNAEVYDKVGHWWNRNHEIDLVAIGEEAILFGECKWSTKAVGTNILDDLKQKSHVALRSIKNPPKRVNYVLFSRSGFTENLQAVAKSENIQLLHVDELF
ncbi:MAG: ATP-binding protein [Chloroflexota bacterium]